MFINTFLAIKYQMFGCWNWLSIGPTRLGSIPRPEIRGCVPPVTGTVVCSPRLCISLGPEYCYPTVHKSPISSELGEKCGAVEIYQGGLLPPTLTVT